MEFDKEDLDAIANMVQHSGDFGLTVEVVHTFANLLLSGTKNIPSAANAALLEWDI